MSTRDLIDAIESGNSSAIQQHFQDAIMSRVAERLDTMRIETAKSMFKSSVNEEVEQIDELSKDTLMSYVNKVSADSQKHPQDPTKRSREKANRSVAGFAKAYNKLTKNEEAELDENVDHEYLEQVLADNDINSKVMGNTVHVDHDNVEKAQELVKYHGYDHKVIGGLNEVLKKSDPASKWIKDFVDSDDPKFKGKTKAERTKMALGAYYGAQRNESAELDEGFPYDVDHMPGRRLSMVDVNKTAKYTVATNSIGGHKEQRVEVDATSKNHARNLAADHFVKNGLKPRVHFDGVRVVNEETECNKDDKMNETSCSTKKKWGAIKNSMGGSTKK